jgi:hypothetical protein
MPEVCVRARRRRAETQHAGETLAPVLIVYVGEVGVTCAADVLGEAIMTDGQRPLAGSAQRLLGREIKAIPPDAGRPSILYLLQSEAAIRKRARTTRWANPDMIAANG